MLDLFQWLLLKGLQIYRADLLLSVLALLLVLPGTGCRTCWTSTDASRSASIHRGGGWCGLRLYPHTDEDQALGQRIREYSRRPVHQERRVSIIVSSSMRSCDNH